MATDRDKEAEPLIDIERAAVVTGYSVSTLYTYVSKRRVPFHQAGPGMPLRFRESELLEWKRRRTEPKPVVGLDDAA